MSTSSRASAPWGLLVVLGALSLIGGIVLIVWPGPSLTVIGLVVGIDLVCLSAMQLFNAAASPLAEGHRVSAALIALVLLIAGLVFLARPDHSLAALAIVLGIGFVLVGLLRLLALGATEHRGPLIMRALVDLAIGVVLIAWPDIGLKTFAVVAGIGFIAQGVVAILAGLALRHETTVVRPAPPPAPRLA